MVRLLILTALSGFVVSSASAGEIATGHQVSVGLDVSYLDVTAYPSWTEGSVGKLRHSDDGLSMNRAFAAYHGRWADTLQANLVLEAYADDLGSAIDATQAWLEWRPVPRSATRYRARLGAFYPRISLENVMVAWSSPYAVSSSAINTWIAEEVRALGIELSVSRRPVSLGGLHAFAFDVAAFRGNDPAGSLLAWKGWSVHDRQSRFGDKLPLPPLPQIQPGMMFALQDPYVAPFREIDGRSGYYAAGEWRYGEQLLLRLGHYDNRADPTLLEDGQYAWRTEFDHLGLQTTLPGDIGFIVQWMAGTTEMGPILFAHGAHAVDADFNSYFALLSREFAAHRWTIRYDNFRVAEDDQTVADNNAEDGHAVTIAYQLAVTDKFSLGAEWLRIRTRRPGWAFYGLEPGQTESQLQVLLRLRL